MDEKGKVVSAWAQNIRVRARRLYLDVRGEEAEFDVSLVIKDPTKRKAEGLLAEYEQYVRGKRRLDEYLYDTLPHQKFKAATSDKLLIAFVSEYGPVVAKKAQYHANDKIVQASQGMAVLRREQQIFACAAGLLEQIKLNKRAMVTVERAQQALLMSQELGKKSERFRLSELNKEFMRRMKKSQPVFRAIAQILLKLAKLTAPAATSEDPHSALFAFPWHDPSLDQTFFVELCLQHEDYVSLFRVANQVLCRLLDKFPPKLHFDEGQLYELPQQTVTGVRPTLYFMLRREYQLNCLIRTCEECGKAFEVKRAGSRFCNEPCSHRNRQRKYWDSKGRSTRLRKSRRNGRIVRTSK